MHDGAMPQSEFDIIKDYFTHQQLMRDDVVLGIGDDAAIVSVPDRQQLVVAMDTLVAGVHFPLDTAAEDIAYKALAVNLSDLAAMGAEPAWFTLALTLPSADRLWLDGFANGLFRLADQYSLQLVGGDTTQGPLTVSIQIAGYVPSDMALTRGGASVGDSLYVTGTLGDAALGLRCLQQPDEYHFNEEAIKRLNRPQARVEVGLALRNIATACIDVSDGLLADLGHILTASHVGAQLDRNTLPLSPGVKQLCERDGRYYDLALSGGDDYELCFCVSPENETRLKTIAAECRVPLTRIGQLKQDTGISLLVGDNMIGLHQAHGFEHFTG